MNTLILLAQDSVASPWEKYFSFIILGLLMTIGYVVVRLQKPSKKEDHSTGLEASLRDAEREVLLSLPPKKEPTKSEDSSLDLKEPQDGIDPLDAWEENSPQDSNETSESEKKERGEENRD